MFDNNDDRPPTVPSSASLIAPCLGSPTHLSNLIDLAPDYPLHLKYQIFTSLSSPPLQPSQTWTFLHIKLSVGSENLDSSEEKQDNQRGPLSPRYESNMFAH